MLEVHRRYEPGQGILPPPQSAVVLVVAEPVHDVHQDHDSQEDVEAGPGEQAGARACQIRAAQPVNLIMRTNVCFYSCLLYFERYFPRHPSTKDRNIGTGVSPCLPDIVDLEIRQGIFAHMTPDISLSYLDSI